MAVIPVEKIHIVVHKSIKDPFLHDLQKAGIVHITELRETTPRSPEMLNRINEALGHLSTYKKRSLLETFVKIRKPIAFDEFEEVGRDYNYQETIKRYEEIKKEKETCLTRLRTLNDDIELITPWIPFPYDLGILKKFKETEAIACIIPSKDITDRLFVKLEDIPCSFELANTVGSASYYIFFVKKADGPGLRSRLIENGGEIIDFKGLVDIPVQLIADLNNKVAETKKQLDDLNKKEGALMDEISKLEIASDLISNKHIKEEIAQGLPETVRTFNIIGWVRKKDMKHLDALTKKAELAVYERVRPEAEEKPPVALKNPKWSSPYEMLIKLYSMPNPKEYDPTVFLAIFFPIFFALCLTDAVYGIFLIAFSIYLLKKVAGDKSLIWILFAGGVCTIFTGSMVGGWAGNLFDLIGIKFLKDFKDSLMLFDPLVTPMPFFYLAIGIGYVHTLLGILIEVYDDMKNGEYATALFENLTWFFILTGIILYFLLFKNSPLRFIFGGMIILSASGIAVFSNRSKDPKVIDQIAWYVIVSIIFFKLLGGIFAIHLHQYVFYFASALLILEIIRFKETKKILGRLIWGIYNLYGISSFLSNVLSYIRLMALGMVTGGIALTVNLIAWMVIKIPYVGIILALIILVGGHLFNTVINCLGGFIHTLRLQYIEFFGRFYSGGGRPFKPFSYQTNYLELNS